jgi:uncharacterized membrane protein
LSPARWLRAAGGAALAMGSLDSAWLGLIAREHYRAQLGHLMSEELSLAPALAFYAIYVAALAFFAIEPALRARSLPSALARGAFFGLAAYAAFDLTGLALLRDFPLGIALLDLAWGSALSATAAAAGYAAARGRG